MPAKRIRDGLAQLAVLLVMREGGGAGGAGKSAGGTCGGLSFPFTREDDRDASSEGGSVPTEKIRYKR